VNIIEYPLEYGSGYNAPNRIVIHSMAEKIINGDEVHFAHKWLEYLGLSAHALIWPSGDIMICRNTDKGAYHARGFNKNSLGIEFLVEGEYDYASFIEAIKKPWPTKDQMREGIELVKHWQSLFGIGRDHVNRHSDLSPGRKVDPGAGFKWGQFLASISN
jgi:N-acetyl-anhydromuramyl-L-alanine amidase AmpD